MLVSARGRSEQAFLPLRMLLIMILYLSLCRWRRSALVSVSVTFKFERRSYTSRAFFFFWKGLSSSSIAHDGSGKLKSAGRPLNHAQGSRRRRRTPAEGEKGHEGWSPRAAFFALNCFPFWQEQEHGRQRTATVTETFANKNPTNRNMHGNNFQKKTLSGLEL